MTIIFDFDGTIANTTAYFFEMANEVTAQFNGKRITKEQFEKARSAPPKQILRELGVPLRALPGLRKAGHKSFQQRMGDIELIAGMQPVIESLAQDHTLGILTSNDADNVHEVLKRLKIDQHFMFVNSAVSILGKHRALNKIIKRHGINPEQTIYIGDEVRDIEGAQKAGLRVAAVTWGFNTEKILTEYEPDWILRTPTDLREVV